MSHFPGAISENRCGSPWNGESVFDKARRHGWREPQKQCWQFIPVTGSVWWMCLLKDDSLGSIRSSISTWRFFVFAHLSSSDSFIWKPAGNTGVMIISFLSGKSHFGHCRGHRCTEEFVILSSMILLDSLVTLYGMCSCQFVVLTVIFWLLSWICLGKTRNCSFTPVALYPGSQVLIGMAQSSCNKWCPFFITNEW